MTDPFLLQKVSRQVFLLLSGLPKTLLFHNRQHTEDVFLVASNIALLSDLPTKDILIVQLAALFHDTGYAYIYQGHEDKSKLIAANFLLQENCNIEIIDGVIEAIEATKLPQQPKNELQNILCDADLAHLARADYPEYADRLQKEWVLNQIGTSTGQDWIRNSLNFMHSHQFTSKFGKEVLQPEKQKNIDYLTTQLTVE